jgi:hypothetical protein
MKPEFMRLRRALAGTVAALLLAAGIVVMSPALSASAHHNTITTSASCVNSQWTITWTITNSESDKSEQITSSSDQSIIANGTEIAKGGSYTRTEIVSGPVKKTLQVSATWSNGVKNTASKTIYPGDFTGTCQAPDVPSISVTSTCTTPGAATGTVSFTLTGVTKSYTVKLISGDTTKATITSTGGTGSFNNVSAGTYTVKAYVSGGPSATSGPVRVETCAPTAPDVDLAIETCTTTGIAGTVTVNLRNLVVGSSYGLRLYSGADVELHAVTITATATTHTASLPARGPGEYYAKVLDSNGAVLTVSADATIVPCAKELDVTVQLVPCEPMQTGNDRKISATVDGLTASTVYTVRLVTADASATAIASTTTPGGNATSFSYTFTDVPTPGNYKVEVVSGSARLVSDTITAPQCNLVTLAPPSIELTADKCETASSAAPAALTARMTDLDSTKTYYVRIVDASGKAAAGGEDKMVSGVTTATVKFPKVTTPGHYTAQLLIEPGKQLAATSEASAELRMCLPTLAMTGPGELLPLGGIAALLLTLGGAVVTGRLRRRMAL